MSIDVDKTRTPILSSNNADHSWNPHFTIDQTPIDTVKETKFLGVTIDSGLRFVKQIDNTVAKRIKRGNIIKFLAGKEWGQQLKTKRKIYLTYMRGCLEYASPCWWPCISKNNQSRLETVQRSALGSIAGLY